MPVDTLNEMILGFAVILGVVLIYVLSLILRTRRAKKQHENSQADKLKSTD
jgi:hypothetical protein